MARFGILVSRVLVPVVNQRCECRSMVDRFLTAMSMVGAAVVIVGEQGHLIGLMTWATCPSQNQPGRVGVGGQPTVVLGWHKEISGVNQIVTCPASSGSLTTSPAAKTDPTASDAAVRFARRRFLATVHEPLPRSLRGSRDPYGGLDGEWQEDCVDGGRSDDPFRSGFHCVPMPFVSSRTTRSSSGTLLPCPACASTPSASNTKTHGVLDARTRSGAVGARRKALSRSIFQPNRRAYVAASAGWSRETAIRRTGSGFAK